MSSVAVLLVSAAMMAAASPDTALHAADDALSNADFAGAIKSLDSIDVGAATPTQLAHAELLRAEADLGLGDKVASDAALREALRLDPSSRIDAKKSGKTLAEMMEKLRSELVGTLSIHSTPKGAELRVDGHDVGAAPKDVEVSHGSHHVEAAFSDGTKQAIDVIARGQQTDVAFVRTVVEPERPPSAPEVVAPARTPSHAGVYLAVGGGLAAIAGAALVVNALSWNQAKLAMPIDQAAQARSSAELQRDVGIGLIVAGAATTVTGIAISVHQPDDSAVSMTVSCSPSGIAFTGAF